MTMLNISTVGLDLKGARPLQRELKVNILSHLHLLIKQRCLTLLGQAAACILQAADDPRRALQHSLHASEWPLALPNASKAQLAVRHVKRNKHTAKICFLCNAPCSAQYTTCTWDVQARSQINNTLTNVQLCKRSNNKRAAWQVDMCSSSVKINLLSSAAELLSVIETGICQDLVEPDVLRGPGHDLVHLLSALHVHQHIPRVLQAWHNLPLALIQLL